MTLVEKGETTEVTMRLVFGSKEERDEKVAKQSLDALAEYVATLAR